MSIFVHPVDHDAERDELLAMLQTNLPALPHARRFEWLYQSNPDGPAWSWFARDSGTGRVVGVASVFPRSMWVADEVKLCGQVGDFAIAASHRTLGPALMIQKATFCPVQQAKLSFCYDCPPHDAGMSTFRRLGLAANCVVDRYALPLRVNSKLRSRLGSDPDVLSVPANLLLRAYSRPRLSLKDIEVSEHTGRFGDEFSELDRTVRLTDGIRSSRDAVHLNWRYRQDPLNEYRILTARRKGELVGFLVFVETGENLTIVDLFGAASEVLTGIVGALLQEAPSHCQSVEAFLSKGSELGAALVKARFRRRAVAAQVVAYANPGSEMAAFLQQKARWAFNGAEIRA